MLLRSNYDGYQIDPGGEPVRIACGPTDIHIIPDINLGIVGVVVELHSNTGELDGSIDSAFVQWIPDEEFDEDEG